MTYIIYRNFFYSTFTILNWRKLLLEEQFITIILKSFQFLHDNKRWQLFGFVIMPNHIHVMYEVLEPYTNEKIKHSFLSYTAHEFSALMSLENKKPFIVNKSNRNIQYWKSSSLSVEIFSPKFFSQKMNYIHNNPLKAGLVSDNKDYTYCSYRSYEEGKPIFDFLTLF